MSLASPELDLDISLGLDMPYEVVLHNDTVNTFDYVILCLTKVVEVSMKVAADMALRVHENGSAVVWAGPQDEAVDITRKLQSLGLTATCRKML